MKHKTSPRDSKKKGAPRFELSLIAGALGGFIAGRRLPSHRQMPHLEVWQGLMAEQRGKLEAAMLGARVQTRYDEHFGQRPRFRSRALRFHFESNILPTLALYQVLQETSDNASPDELLAEVARLLEVAMRDRLLRRSQLFAHIPRPFAAFRLSARWFVRLLFPPSGWDMKLVEDNDQCFAFDVHRCFYLDVLTAYAAPELTQLFCRLDDLAYEALPPAIRWQRSKTLGRGDDCCDFRWCRATPEMMGEGV